MAKKEDVDSCKAYHLDIDAIPLNVAIYRFIDDDFLFIDINSLAEKSEGMLRKKIIGESLLSLFPVAKECGLYDALLRVYQSGKKEVLELTSDKDSEHKRWRKNSISRLDNSDVMVIYEDLTQIKEFGNIDIDENHAIRIIGTVDDIAKQSHYDKLKHFQKALLHWSKVDYQNLSEAIKKACEISANAMDVHRVSIWLYHDNHSILACLNLFNANTKEHSNGLLLKSSDYPNYFNALKGGEPLIVKDAQSDSRTSEFLEDYLKPQGIISMLDVPIMSQGKMIGVVCNEQVNQGHKWDLDEVEFSNAIAGSIALAFEIEKRRQSEEKESRVSKLIHNSQTIVFYWRADEHWSVEFVSDNVEQLGYSSEDFLLNKLKFADIIHPDDLERVIKEVSENTSKGVDKFTQIYRIISHSGEIHWIDDRTVIERDADGLAINYLGTIIDITQQRALENRLSLLGNIIDESLNEVYIFKPNNLTFTYANKAAQNHIGYSLQELQQMTPLDIIPEFTNRMFQKKIEPLVHKEEEIVIFETVHEGKHGRSYEVEVHIQIIEVGGVDHFVVIALDIGDRKEIQRQVTESEEKFRSIAENALMGIFIFQERYIYCNDGFTEMTGYRLEELEDRDVWDIVEKSMQDTVKMTIEERLKGRGAPQQDRDIKILTKNRGYRTFRVMTQTIHIAGRLAGLGTMIDITDIKETKKQLTILAQAVEQTDDLIRIVEPSGKISFINDSFIAHTGYTRRELIGQDSKILKSGEHDKAFFSELWKTLLAGDVFRCQFINRKKDGNIYYEEATITPILDERQRVQNFVVTGKDVTERIELEKELKRKATTDELTGLYNRHKGNEILDIEVQRSQRYENAFSVIFFDIDYFKKVNDQYGHDVGDSVLMEIAQLVKLHTRKSDAIIRWGGEEFIIIALNLDQEQAETFSEKLRQTIELYQFEVVGKVTVSIGIASFGQDDTKESLVKRADEALYRAKEKGRNRVES